MSSFQINFQPGAQAAFESDLLAIFEQAQPAVHGAMRDRLYDIIMANFGIAGPERPWAWHPLSDAYARKVGRPYATLHVTGALQDSILKGGLQGDSTVVEMSDLAVPYATAHHDGSPEGNRGHPGLPARRVFPLQDDGEVLPWTRDQITEAAARALQEALS